MSLVSWSIMFPYQLSDMTADIKAKLRNSHTVLGMQKSILVGAGFGVVGIASFVFSFNPATPRWSAFLIGLTIYALIKYRIWYHLPDGKAEESMQNYVRVVKPITQVFFFYLVFAWFSMGRFI